MTYRNGREAKSGDNVVHIDPVSGRVRAGIVHMPDIPGSAGNVRLASPAPEYPHIDPANCVHADDVAEAFPAKKD